MDYLYILLCADNSLYTGITNNVEHRLRNHRNGSGSKYVHDRLPIKLVYVETHTNKYLAAQRERQIKGWRRQKKMEILHLNL